MEQLEKAGIVDSWQGAKPRAVWVEDFYTLKSILEVFRKRPSK